MKAHEAYISPGYEALQRELHLRPKGYGGKGFKWADTVIALLQRFDAVSILDYGCGEGSLARKLADRRFPWLRISEYDPAIDGKNGRPAFADLVTVTDVLEHVEPECLSAVLGHLHGLARKAVFFVVALDEANKVLADGRNAHLILESPEWWESKITAAGFTLLPGKELLTLPWPMAYYSPEKRAKRWIGVGIPC